MREKTETVFHHITDVFSGADGGVEFVMIRDLIEQVDKQAAAGDLSSISLLDIMVKFDRLLTAATK